MLLLGPVQAVRGFLIPAIIAGVGFGSGDLRRGLVIAAITLVVSLVVGMLPWLTTTFRITSTALMVRTGLLRRKTLTAPLDRVRSVDLQATLLHRLLRLRKVQVGTGVDDGAIELDSLAADTAEALHSRLLSGSLATRATPEVPPEGPTGGLAPTADNRPGGATGAGEQVLALFRPGWAKFAPFSLGPLAVVAGLFGAASQLDLPFASTGEAVWDWLIHLSFWVLLLLFVGGGLVLWCALTMLGYLLQWWDLRLVRTDGSLRLTRGLFTTTSTTVEEARIRGVEVKEPVLLRAVGGARLDALVTGLDNGTYGVLPQVPLPVAHGVAAEILRADPRAPLTVPLRAHGAAAHRRALLRGVRLWLACAAAVCVAFWLADRLSWPWAVATGVAAVAWGLFSGSQAYRNLGHALTEEHLVIGAASLTRTRTVLQRDGVIGWVLDANWFQRRMGLVDLTATTAAGSESVELVDVPRAEAEALVRALTPEWA